MMNVMPILFFIKVWLSDHTSGKKACNLNSAKKKTVFRFVLSKLKWAVMEANGEIGEESQPD